jgi:hypothetical protein
MITSSDTSAGPVPVRRKASGPNVIILTSGLSGSSVLAGLISRQGYWTGVDTFKKEYDTFENVELIRLNKQLMAEVGYTGRYEMEFHQKTLDLIGALDPAANGAPYRNFLKECDQHGPWIWKDPRLWLTIRYWGRLIDWSRCRVILLTRDFRHSWVSMTLRRSIRSYSGMKRYETSIERTLTQFVEARGIDALRLRYEDLIAAPEKAIERLNRHIGSTLTVDDLRAIYRGELYRAPRNSLRDFITAMLIYAKNRPQRWDLRETKS